MLNKNSSAIRLAIGVVLVNLFIYFLIGAWLYKSRQHYEQQAALTTQNLANSLENTISGFLEKMDISLFSIKNEVERELAAGGINEKVLNAYIIREKTIIPTFEEMWVADRDGNVRYGTKLIPHQPVNITDREYFQRLRNNPGSGLVISKPVIGRITKTWSMLISKRINNADGSFAGLAFGSLRFADYFDGLFSQINVGKQGIIEFRDAELALIDQYPDMADSGGQVGSKMVSTLAFDKIRANPNFGTYNTIFKRDGIERTVSYKKITGYPFYLAVSLGRNEYLSAWRKEVAANLSLLLLFTLITAFSARMFFLRRVQAALHKEEAHSLAILETSPVPLMLIDDQGVISYLNNAFTKQIGYNRDEIPTLADWRIRAFPNPQYREAIIAKAGINLEKLKAHEPIAPFEADVICKDGIARNFIVDTTVLQRDHSNGALVSLYNITERKQAEENILEMTGRLNLATASAKAGVWDWNIKTNEMIWDDRMLELYGFTPENFPGGIEAWERGLHPDDSSKAIEDCQAALRGEQNFDTEFRVRHPNGTILYIKANGLVLRDEQGNPLRMIGLNTDITDRKRAEEEQRETESRFRAFVEQSPVAIGVFSLDGITLYANQKFIETLGWQRSEEVVGRPAVEYFSPQFREESKERTRRRLAGLPVPPEYESTSLRADGAEFPVHVAVAPIQLSGRTVSIAFLTDITTRKEAEDELRESEAKFRILFETSRDFLYRTSIDGKIIDVNAAASKISGYSQDELKKMNMMELYFDSGEREALVKKIMEQGFVENYEIKGRRKDGTIVETLVTSVIRKDNNGNPIGFQGGLKDITEIKKVEKEKTKLQGQLLQSQKMESVGRLAGGVAHDFNNMLGLILGHAELALEQADPTHPHHAALQEIRKAAERSADLTRQLLAFARQQTVSLKVMDLNEAITNMLKMLQRLIGEDIDLKWQSEANLWSVKMDPSQIDQILANLCINARDAISDTGKITIETGNIGLNEAYCADHAGFVPGEYVMLIVSDDGCGIDKETREKIFEPFFTTKGVGKGTGLGLSTVFGIVKQNNGFINVYSEPGQGTTFTIYLPRYVGKVEQVQPEVKQAPAQRGQETVLLVEDEPDILNLTKMLLERQGYTVLAANTPGKAISLAGEHVGEINLLMTDVVMPEMNGRDLAKMMLDLYPHLKRLFTSGYTADVIAQHGVLDEGVHFIQKPFSIKALAAKVREVLDQK
ncbi:MAG: PAS domain S-box protein [Syntrophales bacterium]